MTPAEAQALLTICAAFDNRKPDPDAAQAWSLALAGLRFEDCRDAIVKHYQESREWIMPADVRAEVKRVRGGRVDHETVPIPPGFDPDDTSAYQRLLAESRRAQADGREVVLPEYRPTRHIRELTSVFRALPPAPVKPREKTAEHDERLAAARAELDNHPARREPQAEVGESETAAAADGGRA